MDSSVDIIYLLSSLEKSITQRYKNSECFYYKWESNAWRFWSVKSSRPGC